MASGEDTLQSFTLFTLSARNFYLHWLTPPMSPVRDRVAWILTTTATWIASSVNLTEAFGICGMMA